MKSIYMKSLNVIIILLISINSISIVFGQNESNLSDLDSWQFSSQRPELVPKNYIDKEIKFYESPTLATEGGGNQSANGCWYKSVEVEPSSWYEFKVHFLSENIEELNRSVLARLLWFNDEGKQIARPEYPATSDQTSAEKWNIIKQDYRVPEGVTKAKIELVYRWDADGVVRFGGVTLEKIENPGSRTVRLATIHHRPGNSSGPKENLQQFAELIEQAAIEKADIVCLPEGITLVGTGLDYVTVSEPVPGPTTNFLGEIARKNSMYIVAGILEKDGETVYNTAVLINRKGEVAGKYHKVSLPREEIEGGVTPGDTLPVFDTDFGKIGMMICWDVTFPEAARTLAFQGAEVIFLPIWGGHLILAKARALENQVYLVSSSYDMKTAVFDQEGKIIKEATEEDPVIVVEVDLNKKKYWPWLGDFKGRIKREVPTKKALFLD